MSRKSPTIARWPFPRSVKSPPTTLLYGGFYNITLWWLLSKSGSTLLMIPSLDPQWWSLTIPDNASFLCCSPTITRCFFLHWSLPMVSYDPSSPLAGCFTLLQHCLVLYFATPLWKESRDWDLVRFHRALSSLINSTGWDLVWINWASTQMKIWIQ